MNNASVIYFAALSPCAQTPRFASCYELIFINCHPQQFFSELSSFIHNSSFRAFISNSSFQNSYIVISFLHFHQTLSHRSTRHFPPASDLPNSFLNQLSFLSQHLFKVIFPLPRCSAFLCLQFLSRGGLGDILHTIPFSPINFLV